MLNLLLRGTRPLKQTNRQTQLKRLQIGTHDRHYLSGVTYVLPKDLSEDVRLDFQHHLLYTVLGNKHMLAPIGKHTTSVLDVATGTGRWAHEIAHLFPQAQVVGLDMEVPATPAYALPANYHFQQGNIFAGLPFDDDTFDFVHQRFLVLALPAKQWPFILSELVRVTQPGGWIELVEGGGNFTQIGPATMQLKQWWDVASQAYGIDVGLMAQLPLLLQNAGLQHIHHRTYQVPVGDAGGRVGRMLQQDILASLPAIQAFICKHAFVSEEQFAQVVAALPQEWKAYRTHYDYYLAYGQKEIPG